ncbi:hypothetical protein BBJ28_00020251 [Nothophytophthora sp. Chile5]|nr:hypothetical protein BBJ28_00020251 [Nothophytophthora sp. Chile5]
MMAISNENAMSLIQLEEARTRVGQCVCFTAAIQLIATGKRALVAHHRVQTYHVLHVADATRQFFKVTCWGDAPPSLSSLTASSESEEDTEHAGLSSSNSVIRVGDILLFSSCRIKSYRGNVEAQFVQRNEIFATPSTSSSTVQLLYRNDRYFNARDVRLKDLYPMIKWYKQHRREFLVADEDSASTSATSEATRRRSRSTIKDLRENMVASVVCKLRRPQEESNNPSYGAGAASGDAASELGGVLLCELVMYDAPQYAMLVNLWDQHAEKRFVARLLKDISVVAIDGIVVSLQALSNRLVANTTPQTTFCILDGSDREAIELEKRLGTSSSAAGAATPSSYAVSREPPAFLIFEELETSTCEGGIVLENVRVERISFARHCGSESKILPRFTPQLVECYCSSCDQVLPELPQQDDTITLHYGACENRCKTRRGGGADAPHSWRYRRCAMILRDARNERLQVEVESQAIMELAGNIDARLLVEPPDPVHEDPVPLSSRFHMQATVASLLNTLVEDGSQSFQAELNCLRVRSGNGNVSQTTSDSTQEDSLRGDQAFRRVFTLTYLAPSPSDKFPVTL